MSEFAEPTPNAEATKIENTEVIQAPEVSNEVRESAGHAAAILALTETATQNDFPQDRVDTMRAQIDAKFAAPAPEASQTGGLVSAIEAAHDESENSERSHAAALAAIDQGHKRAELLNLDDVAAHSDWPQDRIDAAKAKIEEKYATK